MNIPPSGAGRRLTAGLLWLGGSVLAADAGRHSPSRPPAAPARELWGTGAGARRRELRIAITPVEYTLGVRSASGPVEAPEDTRGVSGIGVVREIQVRDGQVRRDLGVPARGDPEGPARFVEEVDCQQQMLLLRDGH